MDFNKFRNQPGQIEKYKKEATTILQEYGNILFKDKLDEIEKFYRLKGRRSFAMGILQGSCGSLLYTILIGILVIALWSAQLGVTEILETIFNVDIVPKE